MWPEHKEAEAGGLLQVQGQPGLHEFQDYIERSYLKKKKKKAKVKEKVLLSLRAHCDSCMRRPFPHTCTDLLDLARQSFQFFSVRRPSHLSHTENCITYGHALMG